MEPKLSKRLLEIVDAFSLREGIRVLEIGCGPGAMAREISRRIGNGTVLAIDRSAKAIQQAISGSWAEIGTGRLSFRQCTIEKFELAPGERPFDIAVAVRHPEIEKQALQQIVRALTKGGRLYIDGGKPLKNIEPSIKKKYKFLTLGSLLVS